jgi:8-oxo-dGTP pyrophosphatase MutT (NUDIX family)
MELRSTKFIPNAIESNGIGAGILPYAVDPQGVPHFLLGRERFIPSWRGSCRWSGFEGSRKENETMLQTALREFEEESLGVICTAEHIENVISSESYEFRIVLRIVTDRDIQRYHSTYVIRIPWDADLPEQFQRTRSAIEHVDRLQQEFHHARQLTACPDTEDIGTVETVGEGYVRVMRHVSTAPCIVHTPWAIDHETQIVSAVFHGQEAQMLSSWNSLRSKLERAVIASGHPSLVVERDTVFEQLQRVRSSRDHLEKDQIRWWSLPDLSSVLRNRGVFGSERFRPYFLPVLQTAISELTSNAADASDFQPHVLSHAKAPHGPVFPRGLALPDDHPKDA